MVVNKGPTLHLLWLLLLSSAVVVLGFSQVDYTVSEGSESGVRVDLLFGQLERSVAVLVNSTQESTATLGQGVWVCLTL